MPALTLTQRSQESTTGTFPKSLVDRRGQLIPQQPLPPPPRPPPAPPALGGTVYGCPASVAVGDVVFAAAGAAQQVVKADAQSFGPVLGVVSRKVASNQCEVVHQGFARAFSELEPGKRYYLSADGHLMAAPLAMTLEAYVHYVGVAVAADTLVVQPSYPLLKRAS